MITLAIVGLLAAEGAANARAVPPKPSYALSQLFKNLNDKIPSDTCDGIEPNPASYKGKPVRTLLSDWIDSKPDAKNPDEPNPTRKFFVACEDANVVVKGRTTEGWVCSLYIEHNKENVGGVFSWYLTRDRKTFIRGEYHCHETSDPPVPSDGSAPPKKKQ